MKLGCEVKKIIYSNWKKYFSALKPLHKKMLLMKSLKTPIKLTKKKHKFFGIKKIFSCPNMNPQSPRMVLRSLANTFPDFSQHKLVNSSLKKNYESYRVTDRLRCAFGMLRCKKNRKTKCWSTRVERNWICEVKRQVVCLAKPWKRSLLVSPQQEPLLRRHRPRESFY